MKISVIIATYNRAGRLSRCLDAFEKVRFPHGWEVVVADNNSTDGTAQLLEEKQRKSGFELVCCREVRPGPSAARNTAVNQSRGELLVFLDDDCYPAEDYLEQVFKLFEEHPEIGFGGGRVLLFDPSDLPLTLQESNEPQALPVGRNLHSGTIHGANMVFRREAFFRIRGFDEELGPANVFASGEDTDLLRRALFCGYPGYYDPTLVVYHHHERKLPSERKRLHQSYDRGMGAGFMKQLCYQPDKKAALKAFWWHWRTAPWPRRLRQLRFFFQYGVYHLRRPVRLNEHLSGLRSDPK